MSKASYLSQPTIMRIPNLLEEVRDGIIAIPRFQRPYVWLDQQRLELMESIYQGLPIGSLLVWRTPRRKDLKTFALRGTQRATQHAELQYLLDGHQRVTTLFSTLGPGLLDPEDQGQPPLIAEDEDDYGDFRPIYFDLLEEVFLLQHRRRKPAATWLPLSILFDDLARYEFQEQLARSTEPSARRSLINRVRILHKTFNDYAIATVPIIADDLDLVTKSFQRVNSAGTPLSEVHMVSALTYIKGIDINERMETIGSELSAVGWQDLDEQMILNLCKARLDIEMHRKNIGPLVEKLKKKPQLLEEARDALFLAAEFLADECQIFGPQTLPYSYQIVLLADVLWRIRDLENQEVADDDAVESALGEHRRQQLARWLWITSYGEYFASMTSASLRRARDHLLRVARGSAEPRPPDMPSEIGLPGQRFDFRTARSRVMALTIADLGPRLSSILEPPTETPHELLAQHGRHALSKLLQSSEVGTRASAGFENCILAAPPDARAVRHALCTRGAATAEELLSHGITEEAARALHDGERERFLELRRTYLLEREQVNVKELGLTYLADE